MPLNKDFWEQKYERLDTGWDIGYVSTPLKEYIDQLSDKSLKILIPGCGNAWEAEYLYNRGFKQVSILDWSQAALDRFSKRVPGFPVEHLVCDDFFNHRGQYNLILEQTFFCALQPEQRSDYARHMHRLLKPGGKIAGVLFDDPLFEDHPPYGGNAAIYRPIFEPWFDITIMEPCYNSIPPRAGRELFIILIKKPLNAE